MQTHTHNVQRNTLTPLLGRASSTLFLSQRRARATEGGTHVHTRDEAQKVEVDSRVMDDVSSAMSSSSRLPPRSPFDSYRDHIAHRHDGGKDHPESWGSGGNSSNSPHGRSNNNDNMDENRDMNLHGMQDGEGSGTHQPKKRRFVCPHCTRAFARSGHLQRHERSRTIFFFTCESDFQIQMNDPFSVRSVRLPLVV